MPEMPDFQSVMLEKAHQDAQAAGAMLNEPRVSDEIIGFHCQQAIEKSVKAVLELLRIEYLLTHDLVLLLGLLAGRAPSVPSWPRTLTGSILSR
jgi:HEPN domain-containing protein